MNRLRHESDWGFRFYELLLNTVLLACNRYSDSEIENVEKLKEELAELDAQVIESKDALMAHRLFEMAVSMICHTYGIKICFLFDEFDEIYQTMPKEVFAQLRAIRDANKYRTSYILFLRNLPERLRVPLDNEGFYELISRNHVGIGPYSPADTLHVISQLEDRHGYVLDETKREWLKQFSGGHPGLIQALLKLLKDNSDASTQLGNMEWFARQEVVAEEFRKLWEGLLPEERDGLRAIAHGDPNAVSKQTEKLLEAKGLIKTSGGRTVFFTPLLGYWIIISKA
jgi:hypothetical protein